MRVRLKVCLKGSVSLSVGFIYLAVRLARQWMKERGIIDMRVRANEPNVPAILYMVKSGPVFCNLA